jgi:uncharacterized protein
MPLDGREFHFACQPGCTKCCEQEGYVYLTEDDLQRAAAYLGLSPKAFESKYVYRTRHLIRLRVPRHAQCPFLLAEGCSIHPAKPTQCRAYPFWPELVTTPASWHRTAGFCPGIGMGPLVQIETVRGAVAEMETAYPSMYPQKTC